MNLTSLYLAAPPVSPKQSKGSKQESPAFILANTFVFSVLHLSEQRKRSGKLHWALCCFGSIQQASETGLARQPSKSSQKVA